MEEVLILNGQQLRDLIYMVYSEEITVIDTIHFRTGEESTQHMEDCYFNYKTVEGLMDNCAEMEKMFSKDDIRAEIAGDISSYLISCANSAFQTIRNYNVRKTYLEKVQAHADSFIGELKELDPTHTADVDLLSKKAKKFYKTMVEYIRMYQSGASDSYSQWLKDQGWTFNELLETYRAQLRFDGPFENLTEEQKLQVYELIIEASGGGKPKFNKSLLKMTNKSLQLSGRAKRSTSLAAAAASASAPAEEGSVSVEWKDVLGTAVLIYTAGKMVWNIYSADHKIEQGVREAVKYAAGKAGNALGEIITAAIETELLVGVEASALFISALGFATGFAAGFVLGAVAGLVLDEIFNSGGKPNIPVSYHCYVGEMPDGIVLARQIAYTNTK